MKLIISAVTWEKHLRGDMRQSELIPLAKELGCVGVEFRPFWHTIEEVTDISRQLRNTDMICVYACNSGLLAQTEEGTRAALTDLLSNVELAKLMGAKVLRLNVSGGSFNPVFIQTEWWKHAVQGVLRAASAQGIVLAVENGPDPHKGDVNILRHILATINDPMFGLTFDTANWLYANTSPEQAFQMLGKHIAYVHLKDLVVDNQEKIHSNPGTGVVDVAGIAKRICANGFTGYLALEFPGGETPIEKVEESIQYLKRAGAY
jgi:sugar phosphate isomerase/epimerase